MSLNIKVIICSTRPGRIGPMIADWVNTRVGEHEAFDSELVDLATIDLPLFDEASHPVMQDYQKDHTKSLAAMAGEADGFVFVTPEFDSFPPASVVNAIQYLVHEWDKKPAAVVSYGGVSGGLRAAQVLRGLVSNVGMMPLTKSFPLPFVHAQLGENGFAPIEPNEEGMKLLLEDLAVWAKGLKAMRA